MVSYFHEQVGMKGEQLALHTITGSSTVEWQASQVAQKQCLTWYKVRMISLKMNKGHVCMPCKLTHTKLPDLDINQNSTTQQLKMFESNSISTQIAIVQFYLVDKFIKKTLEITPTILSYSK